MKENILIRPYFPKDLFHCGALALYGGGGVNPANIKKINSEHISKRVKVLPALCLTRIFAIKLLYSFKQSRSLCITLFPVHDNTCH